MTESDTSVCTFSAPKLCNAPKLRASSIVGRNLCLIIVRTGMPPVLKIILPLIYNVWCHIVRSGFIRRGMFSLQVLVIGECSPFRFQSEGLVLPSGVSHRGMFSLQVLAAGACSPFRFFPQGHVLPSGFSRRSMFSLQDLVIGECSPIRF